MIASIADRARLANGVEMPWLGLGVFPLRQGVETYTAVRAALDAGYRSIDTAAAYHNEASVGKAVLDSGIAREEVFVTTKVWNSDQGYQPTLKAFDLSRKKLGLDTVDLYLIHWPVKGRYLETWRALEKLYRDGLARAIGVSNFQVHHLKEVLSACEIRPMLDQVEFHPQLRQAELHRFCSENSIHLEAWGPLGTGALLKDPTIAAIALKYRKTPAQVLIRWDLQHEMITIPKSARAERIRENAQVFDFALSAEDMLRIDGMDRNNRLGSDPDNFDF